MDIPPGDRRYVVTDSFVLDVDVDLYTIQPHAHLLAKEVKSFATLPDGTRKWLIYIRDWDFNWQGVFRYAQPSSFRRGRPSRSNSSTTIPRTNRTTRIIRRGA